MTKGFLGFTICFASLLFVSPIAHGQSAAKSQRESATQMQFQKLINRYYAAWNTGDPETAAPLYAKDPDLVFYDLAPLKYKGWAEYDKGVRALLSSMASLKITPYSDLRATRRGNIAWTTVTFHLSGKKKNGQEVELDGRHTVIWELRGRRWLIVHEHFSVPLS